VLYESHRRALRAKYETGRHMNIWHLTQQKKRPWRRSPITYGSAVCGWVHLSDKEFRNER